MGYINAVVGNATFNSTVGKFGLEKMKSRGGCLLEFCEEQDMIKTDSMFYL